jgi:hypothetical protein
MRVISKLVDTKLFYINISNREGLMQVTVALSKWSPKDEEDWSLMLIIMGRENPRKPWKLLTHDTIVGTSGLAKLLKYHPVHVSRLTTLGKPMPHLKLGGTQLFLRGVATDWLAGREGVRLRSHRLRPRGPADLYDWPKLRQMSENERKKLPPYVPINACVMVPSAPPWTQAQADRESLRLFGENAQTVQHDVDEQVLVHRNRRPRVRKNKKP